MSEKNGDSAVSSLSYRPEIDGLRALAVMPVILFHAGFHVFSGGFIGVDVFFVISGYLITGILLADCSKGQFSITRFYERRARRILPALFCVIVACLPFAWFSMLPEELARFGKSILAVIGFASNITFWLEEGYFSSGSELKPLLHTWSLAVEEQFYILFPLVLYLIRNASRRTQTLLIGAAALASFALCEMAAYHFQTANFYLAPTRAWELLCGSLCACLGWQGTRRHAGWLAGLGLLLIVVSIFGLDGTLPFPSHWALLPVGGSMLLILFASTDRGAGRLLALPPFVGIGLISYSLYLWHQPVFAFARLLTAGPLSQGKMLGLVVLAIVLAVLSWRFVEQPFRKRSGIGEARLALPIAFGLAIVLAGTGGWLFLDKGAPWRFSLSRDPAISAMTKADPPPRAEGGDCQSDRDGFANPCTIMPRPSAAQRIALYGDSHAQALLPAFRELARQRGAELHYASFGGCPPLLGGYVINGNYRADFCPELARREIAHARAAHIDTVWLAGRWALYGAESQESHANGYLLADRPQPIFWTRTDSRRVFGVLLARTVAAYRTSGINLVIIDEVPSQPVMDHRALKCLAYRPKSQGLEDVIRQSSIKAEDFLELRRQIEPAIEAQERTGVPVLRFDSFFRMGDRFLWGEPGVSWYRDDHHLSTEGALRLVPALVASFDQMKLSNSGKAERP
jgi:peptidoglycan/LPS O-acetylase OafA/YrhL